MRFLVRMAQVVIPLIAPILIEALVTGLVVELGSSKETGLANLKQIGVTGGKRFHKKKLAYINNKNQKVVH